jgi:hypothetical protein
MTRIYAGEPVIVLGSNRNGKVVSYDGLHINIRVDNGLMACDPSSVLIVRTSTEEPHNLGGWFEVPDLLVATKLELPFTGGGSIVDGKLTEKSVHPQFKEEEVFRFKKGDRVKLKYNKSNGTIVEDEITSRDTCNVKVQWDKGGTALWEHKRDLDVLYAPRASDKNPHQEEINAIDAARLPLIAEIEKLQAALGKLTQAKKILERG